MVLLNSNFKLDTETMNITINKSDILEQQFKQLFLQLLTSPLHPNTITEDRDRIIHRYVCRFDNDGFNVTLENGYARVEANNGVEYITLSDTSVEYITLSDTSVFTTVQGEYKKREEERSATQNAEKLLKINKILSTVLEKYI